MPTEPQPTPHRGEIDGTWQGSLQVHHNVALEPWDNVRLVIYDAEGGKAGAMVTANGTTHVLQIREAYDRQYSMQVQGLPADPPCTIILTTTQITDSTMTGEAGGRCPDIIRSVFELRRVD